jgi:polysaccharide biosynthesis/export protein
MSGAFVSKISLIVFVCGFCIGPVTRISAASLQTQSMPGQEMTNPASQQEEQKRNKDETNKDETNKDETNEGVTQEDKETSKTDESEREPLRERPPKLLPPEPNTEFQEFVKKSTGKLLPIFGQGLFRTVPSTFAPLDHVPVPADYVLGPGDELLIRIWGQISFNQRTTVDRNGSIYLPKIGEFNIVGLKYSQLQSALNSELSRVFKNFELSVTLGKLRSIQVFVVGQVRLPGTYTIGSLSTLVNALFASGGPSNSGSMRQIELKRTGRTVATFDLYDMLLKGDLTQDAILLPGDVIFVPPAGPRVAMTGSINNPAIYELNGSATLQDVIGYSGGLSSTAGGVNAILERIDSRMTRSVAELSLEGEGNLNTHLQDGDIVRFQQISPKFENAVTIRGNVAAPGRFPWKKGMRVKDLIPNQDFLTTREFWETQNGLVGLEKVPTKKEEPGAIKNEVKRMGAQINWEYAVIERRNKQDLSAQLIPFNLAQAIAGKEEDNLELESDDIITIFSQADLEVPISQQAAFVQLEGEFHSPGVYQVKQKQTLRQLVQQVGGFTKDAYLSGAVFTRESVRIEQQKRLDDYIRTLEQSVERSAGTQTGLTTREDTLQAQERASAQRRLVVQMRDVKAAGRIVLQLRQGMSDVESLPDIILEDGDRLVVPSLPATVNLVGAIHNNSSLIYKEGKSVRAYLRLSGGISENGDTKSLFVVRADGSAVGRQDNRDLLSMRVMPGDSIIVPEKFNKGNTTQEIKDWTQILFQMAFAAAAIKAL